jgi:hypothetical protein
MLFSLDVLHARKGDCLMLHYGPGDDPRLIIIDGGPSNVYLPHLKPRIAQVHEARGLEEEDPLPVDVVMISHVDDDHIKGILELTKEQRGEPDLRLDVTSLWHNSFDDLLKTRPDELVIEASFGAASLGGNGGDGGAFDAGSVLAGFGQAALAGNVEVEDEDEYQTVQVLASIPQGRQLRDDARVLGWRPNHKFQGKLVLATDSTKPVTLDGGLKLTVVGPMQPELLALQEAHDKWLRQQKDKKKKSPESALAAYVDESVANLSSIVLLAELGDKRMLLTGDARGDKILDGLELVGLLDAGGRIHVDVLKVPHHGSEHNMETEFFERVTADHYVFSGNGEHGNPDRTTLEMLLEARGNANYAIHLTYPVDETDLARKKDWESEQGKEKKRKLKNPAKEVRPNWSPKEHSLAALFDDNPDFAEKVRIVDSEKPHLIDLLDPVKF